jgi:hypothetical protein
MISSLHSAPTEVAHPRKELLLFTNSLPAL